MRFRFFDLRKAAWLGTSVVLCWTAMYWRPGSDLWAVIIVASLPWTAYWLATDAKLREKIADDPQWLLIYMGVSALIVVGAAFLCRSLVAAVAYAAGHVGQAIAG
jgi:hypothetical protein